MTENVLMPHFDSMTNDEWYALVDKIHDDLGYVKALIKKGWCEEDFEMLFNVEPKSENPFDTMNEIIVEMIKDRFKETVFYRSLGFVDQGDCFAWMFSAFWFRQMNEKEKNRLLNSILADIRNGRGYYIVTNGVMRMACKSKPDRPIPDGYYIVESPSKIEDCYYPKHTTEEYDPVLDTGFPLFLASRLKDKTMCQIFHKLLIEKKPRIQVAEEFGFTTDQWVGGKIKSWARKDQGTSFERYFRELVGDPRNIRGHAPHNEPDAISREGYPYSLKSWFRGTNPNERYDPMEDFAPEWDYALEHDTTFTFVLAAPFLWGGRLVSRVIDPKQPPESFTVNRKGEILTGGRRR